MENDFPYVGTDPAPRGAVLESVKARVASVQRGDRRSTQPMAIVPIYLAGALAVTVVLSVNGTQLAPERSPSSQAPPDDPAAEHRASDFAALAQQWKDDCAHSSSLRARVEHPAYRQIVAMGSGAVPLILRDLESNGPGHWGPALRAITGTNPVRDEDAGRLGKIRDAWLAWGRAAGLI